MTEPETRTQGRRDDTGAGVGPDLGSVVFNLYLVVTSLGVGAAFSESVVPPWTPGWGGLVPRRLKPVSRTEVRGVPCPVCGMRAGNPCRNAAGETRSSNHAERVARFVSAERLRMGFPPTMTRAEREEYRALVRGLPCPLCHAGENERCKSRRPEGRLSNHQERVNAWRAVSR